MQFYNSASDNFELLNKINTSLNNANVELKKSWKGPVADKYASIHESINQMLITVKRQLALYVNVGDLLKKLETLLSDIKKNQNLLDSFTELDDNSDIDNNIKELKKEANYITNLIKESLNEIIALKSTTNIFSLGLPSLRLKSSTLKLSDSKTLNNEVSKKNQTNSGSDTSTKNSSHNSKTSNISASSGNIETQSTNTSKENSSSAYIEAQSSSGNYSTKLGQRIVNTSKYANTNGKLSNPAPTGECVWYARNRAYEKMGVDTGALGNGGYMAQSLKGTDAYLDATIENIKPDILVCYKVTGSGNAAGHVVYIEAVEGDYVYYTEGGQYYYKSNTDGVLKRTTKANLIQGLNESGTKYSLGQNINGFIDLSKL